MDSDATIQWLAQALVNVHADLAHRVEIVNDKQTAADIQTGLLETDLRNLSGNLRDLRDDIVSGKVTVTTTGTTASGAGIGTSGGVQGAPGGQMGTQSGQQGGATMTTGPKMKLATPEHFDGTRGEKATKFMLDCRLYISVNYQGQSDQEKISFIISYLEAAAAAWISPFLQEEFINNQPQTILRDFNLFWTNFNNMFGEIDRAETFRTKLVKLTQTKSVTEYLGEFQTYAPAVGYGDIPLRDMFYAGLKDYIKDDMMAQSFDHRGVATLASVSERAIQIDNCHRAREAEKKSNPTGTAPAKTTQVQTATAPTKEKFSVNDKVYTIDPGTGRAKKGHITRIGRNAQGKFSPTVQWDGDTKTVTLPFSALKRDTRPAATTTTVAAPSSAPHSANTSGPQPMELDGTRGKTQLNCYVCGRKGHLAMNCPDRKWQGAEIELESDEESGKGDA